MSAAINGLKRSRSTLLLLPPPVDCVVVSKSPAPQPNLVKIASATQAARQQTKRQIQCTLRNGCCGVCGEAFAHRFETIRCLANLQKRKDALDRRLAILSRHALVRFGVDLRHELSSTNGSLYWRVGYLRNLKRLKVAILTNKTCPACEKPVSHNRTTSLLSSIDRAAVKLTTPRHVSF
jgi:hypothetical protein